MGQFSNNFTNNFAIFTGAAQLEARSTATIILKTKTGTIIGTGVSGKVIF